MQNHIIRSARDGRTLYHSAVGSFRACLEQAVIENTDLSYADLARRDLSNALLDGGIFTDADFTGTNLSGANLSEAILAKACFAGADLYNCCLAESDLRGANFEGASFGATDINGTDMSACRFSALSCFTLDFIHAAKMENCIFTSAAGNPIPFSRPPVVVRGLDHKPIIILPGFWLHGTETFPYTQVFANLSDRLYTRASDN